LNLFKFRQLNILKKNMTLAHTVSTYC